MKANKEEKRVLLKVANYYDDFFGVAIGSAGLAGFPAMFAERGLPVIVSFSIFQKLAENRTANIHPFFLIFKLEKIV